MMPFEVKYLVVIHILLCLCQLIESRNDCGWDVKEAGCPNYGTNEWSCLARNLHCRHLYHVYHCARDYHNKTVYTEACALEKDCKLGTEPQIWTCDLQDETGKVTCELCFGNRYNDIPSQSSAMYWRCSEEQPEYTEGNHLINCHVYTRNWDLKNKRQWSRCDARQNYVLFDKKYDSNGCSNDTPLTCIHVGPCPEGQERLLNYSCVAIGSRAYRQPKTPEELIKNVIRTANQPPETTTYAAYTSSITLKDDNNRQETMNMSGIIASTIVCVVAVTSIVICVRFYRDRRSKQGAKRRNKPVSKQAEQDVPLNTE